MQVKKRNGQVVMFEQSKVSNAIWKAMVEVDEQDEIIMMDITDEIRKLVGLYESVGNDVMSVEAIQDKIEMMLAEKGLFKTSKAYILYRRDREIKRKKGWDLKGLPKDIYEKKYRFKDETFEEFLDRVSGGNSYIKKLMRDKKFLPAGRVLAGRGLNERGHKVVYSNCFVITPPEDNIESIFDTAKKMARTYSMGGGCGTSLENLRPNGAKVNNSAESTTGAVSFMDLYSLTTGLIGMKGRRGALMLTLPVTHPDILEFINVKNDLSKVTKANISVMINDDFMYAVKYDKEWHMKFYADTGEIIERVVPAKLIFHEISKSAWNTAEPGVLYWDRVEKWHINSENHNMKYRSTNPCGEKPLPEGGSCMLASFNFSEYVLNPFTEYSEFDFDSFIKDVPEVVTFMDDLLEEGIKHLPLQEQIESAKDYRQLGIGVMGLADALIKLGIRYGSRESLEFISEVMDIMINESVKQSSLLAKERGSYRAFDKELVLRSPFVKEVLSREVRESIRENGLRNAELLSIAPTGSLSSMWEISGGIEPIFATHYTRKSESLGEDGEPVYYNVYTNIVEEYMLLNDLKNISELPDYFVTAMTLNSLSRIKVQSIMQYYVDSAISSTINLPEETTVEDIERIYMSAWEHGLKGITIYRDGCARGGILTTGDTKKKSTSDQIDELKEQMDKLIVQALEENPETCPMCGGHLQHSGGCETCVDCGYSPCSI